MSNFLEAFGGITYLERTTQVQEKVDDKKNIIKKDQEPKFIEITERLVSYDDFMGAISKISKFDV